MRARENPFRVERLHALEFRFVDGGDLDGLVRRLRLEGGRGAIVGPHGSGKSTLLEQLGGRLRSAGADVRALRIGADRSTLTQAERTLLCDGIGPDSAILLDGAGHLRFVEWWTLARRLRAAGIVVITAHRAGRLQTLQRTRVTPTLLIELVASLGHPLDAVAADAMVARHRGNLRDALRELYDRCASGGAAPSRSMD